MGNLGHARIFHKKNFYVKKVQSANKLFLKNGD
jgi:hypothetical protein